MLTVVDHLSLVILAYLRPIILKDFDFFVTHIWNYEHFFYSILELYVILIYERGYSLLGMYIHEVISNQEEIKQQIRK